MVCVGLMRFNGDTTATLALLLDILTTDFHIHGRQLKVVTFRHYEQLINTLVLIFTQL